MLRNALLSSAVAAGLALAAPAFAQTVPASSWTGPYVGANIGYGGGNSHFHYNGTTDAAGADGASGNVNQSSSGVLGGVQAGYNYQLPGSGVVVGLETDIDAADLGGQTDYDGLTSGGADSAGKIASRIDYLGTLRGRIGYPIMNGRLMPYVTGGFAYGGVKPLSSNDCASCLTGDTGSDPSMTQTGWTVGGGAEVKLNRRLSMKVEYLYVKLGEGPVGTPDGTINTPNYGALYNASLNEGTTANVVRVGLNYHF